MIKANRFKIVISVVILLCISFLLFNSILYYNDDLKEEMKHEFPDLAKTEWFDFKGNEIKHELSSEDIEKANSIMNGTYVEESNEIKGCLLAVVMEEEGKRDGGDEIKQLKYTIREIEDRFNSKFNYPYVILSPKPLSKRVMFALSYLTNAKLRFGIIPHKHWSIPSHIDRNRARKTRKEMKIVHADSLRFRHSNRYWTGFFFKHDLTKDYDYYLRVDGGSQFSCNFEEDPFLRLKNNKQLYGFVQSVHEIEGSIKTLWRTTQKHFKHYDDADIKWITSDKGEYNLCHYWNTFEVASFATFRNSEYLKYFEAIDKAGGIFYERWAEGPLKTIYLNYVVGRKRIHFFDNIGYYKFPFNHCPKNQAFGENFNYPVCGCDHSDSTDLNTDESCNPDWVTLSSLQ